MRPVSTWPSTFHPFIIGFLDSYGPGNLDRAMELHTLVTEQSRCSRNIALSCRVS